MEYGAYCEIHVECMEFIVEFMMECMEIIVESMMECMESMWNIWNPCGMYGMYGIHCGIHDGMYGIHVECMESMWNPFHSTWIPVEYFTWNDGICKFHMESMWKNTSK